MCLNVYILGRVAFNISNPAIKLVYDMLSKQALQPLN